MKIKRLCRLCLVMMTGTLGMALTAAGDPATAPPAVRVQAREIFAHIVGIESSIGKGKVPLVAKYLAERFQAGGFPAADIHILPLGETASLVVRYRGNGRGGRPIDFMAHMDVVTAKRSDWQRDPYRLIEENGFSSAAAPPTSSRKSRS
jgi:acetylornithine deacetylase/succinyl-diaminopimelate desuccinylase-like protein